jgi:hypothetical protein
MVTYYRVSLLHPEYTGDVWTRRQPGAQKPGWAYQKWSWIQQVCRERSLLAEQRTSRDLRYWDQTWIKISRI